MEFYNRLPLIDDLLQGFYNAQEAKILLVHASAIQESGGTKYSNNVDVM